MKIKLTLFFIIVIAIFLRFYQLGNNPPFLNWDEAAWGYNAYAIGIDGKDEFGRFLPHDYLESFGDFKPPVYAYLAVIPVKLFGLNAFATRFPSALFGVMTVLVTYFLVKRLFPTSRNKQWYALASSGILAISPWHIMLSRAAFEANIVTFFIVTGVWLFLAAVEEKPWYLPLSAASFVASLYTFNTGRIVAPLLVIMLSLFFWKKLLRMKLQVVLAVLLGIVFILPTLKFLLSPQAQLRFQEVNIFSDLAVIKQINQEVINDNNTTFSKIIHNRRFVFGVDFLKHYFDNLGPGFLFFNGDPNPKFSIQDVGQMYLWDLPFFCIGILFLIRKKEGYWWIISAWLLLAIIPAATARETPHALRTEVALPTLQIFVAFGIVTTFLFLKEKIQNKRIVYSCAIVSSLFLFWNVLYFQHSYYTYYKDTYSGDWNYTYKDSIAYVTKEQSHYTKIVVADVLGRPYIYYLFYMHISPSEFRSSANIERDVFGFVHINSFGKYIFTTHPSQIQGKNYLYIDSPGNAPKGVHVLHRFANLDGNVILEAYTL